MIRFGRLLSDPQVFSLSKNLSLKVYIENIYLKMIHNLFRIKCLSFSHNELLTSPPQPPTWSSDNVDKRAVNVHGVNSVQTDTGILVHRSAVEQQLQYLMSRYLQSSDFAV